VPGTFAIFFYGSDQVEVPFGDGFLCVGGHAFRLNPPLQVDAAGRVQRAIDLNAPAEPDAAILPGSTWNFQLWYRDTAAGGAGFNFTDGLRVTFCP
jgi:hypothetical protein